MTKTTTSTSTTSTTSTKTPDLTVGFSTYALKKSLHLDMLIYHHYKLLEGYVVPAFADTIKEHQALLALDASGEAVLADSERVRLSTDITRLQGLIKDINTTAKGVVTNIANTANMKELYRSYKTFGRLTDDVIRAWITSNCDLKEGQSIKFGNNAEKVLLGYIQGAIGTRKSDAKTFTEKGKYVKVATYAQFATNLCASLVDYYNNSPVSLAKKYANVPDEYDFQLKFSYTLGEGEDELKILEEVATREELVAYNAQQIALAEGNKAYDKALDAEMRKAENKGGTK